MKATVFQKLKTKYTSRTEIFVVIKPARIFLNERAQKNSTEMKLKKSNVSNYLNVIVLFLCINFSAAYYCKSNTDIPFDDKPVSSKEWDTFFHSLHSNLSSYNVQKDTSVYKGLLEFEDDLESFFEHIKDIFDISRPNYLDNTTLSPLQKEKLEFILDLTLNSEITIKCTHTDILVTGNYISLKKVRELYENYKNTEPLCEKEAIEQKQSIKVFALDTIFIDEGINESLLPSLNKKLPLILIAPTWRIIGIRNINLNGLNGADYNIPNLSIGHEWQRIVQHGQDESSTKPTFLTGNKKDKNSLLNKLEHALKNGKYDGYEKDGVPGLPGTPGGNFLGIGKKFIDGHNLLITSNGGNGASGTNGKSGKITFEETTKCSACGEPAVEKCFKITHNNDHDGGHGGRAGAGNVQGNVTIIDLSGLDQSNISVINEPGESGKNGTGGLAATAGKDYNPEPGKCYLDSKLQKIVSNKDYKFGIDGTDGEITILDDPKFEHYNVSEKKVMMEYQHYFRKNFQISMKQFLELEFVEKLGNNTVSRGLLSADDFYEELDELENEYFRTEKKDDLPPFYEILLNKINVFGQDEKNFDEPLEKKFLTYLYTAILSRKNFLKENLKADFITYVTDFLKDLQNEFKEGDENFTKVKIIENMRNRVKVYKKNIEAESENAKFITQEEVKKDLKSFSDDIEKSISEFKAEVQDQREKKETNEVELQKEQSNLVKDLVIKSAFSVVKLLNAGLAIAGPQGAAASSVLGVGINIVEAYATGSASDRQKKVSAIAGDISKAATDLKKQMTAIQELKEARKVENRRYLLRQVVAETKVKSIEGISWRKLTDREIDGFTEEEIETELDVGKKEMEKSGRFEKLQEFYDKHERFILQAADSVANIAFTLQKYFPESDKVDKLITENRKALEELNKFEVNAYPVLYQELEGLLQQYNDLSNNAGKRSKVDFDISRKNMQFFLDKTKKHLKALIGDYAASNNLIFDIEKLEKTLPYLFTSNSVIKDFQEQQDLADLLEALSPITVNGVFNDKDVKIKKLDAKIYSNILMKKYKLAYQALEQYAFPLAGSYLDDFDLPENLRVNYSMVEVVKIVDDKLTIINKKIDDYKKKIFPLDSAIIDTFFNGQLNSSAPFYEWKNEEYNDIISKLLAGKEVYLNADIMKSSFEHKQAIKFDEIELYLKVKNETEQQNLKQLLSFFEIELTHLGDNHYKFNNKIYRIKTVEVPLYYSFDFICSEFRERTTNSVPYKKLKSGELLLSPYATWKIKLHKIEGKPVKYEDLKPYEDKIDLELGGHGSYVRKSRTDKIKNAYKSLVKCDIIPKKDSNQKKREIDFADDEN